VFFHISACALALDQRIRPFFVVWNESGPRQDSTSSEYRQEVNLINFQTPTKTVMRVSHLSFLLIAI
jgi:hypothetical protein